MDRKELEDYMLKQLPAAFNKSERTVVRDVISAVAAGIIKAKEVEIKEVVHALINYRGD